MDNQQNGMNAAAELNRVDGFDPAKYLRKLGETDESGLYTERFYLDVASRKLWFRLKYPQGAVRKLIREITDTYAVVEARVYLDRSDPPENYIANSIVKRYFDPDDRLGDRYLEIAETAAAGRALADAGFGIQFTDSSENPEQGVVDAPIGIPHGIERTSVTGEVTHGPKTGTAVSDAAKTPAPSACESTDCRNTAAAYSAKSSVEEIMAVLTFEDALNVTIDSGFYRGKTLGQIAKEKPQSLDWYVNQYRGGNNILRAAARVLLDRAAV